MQARRQIYQQASKPGIRKPRPGNSSQNRVRDWGKQVVSHSCIKRKSHFVRCDASARFNYNWNRYYDPTTAKYITSDPIGLEAGINTYGYVSQNPGVGYDPQGLRIVALEANLLGIGVGIFVDTGTDSATLFEGIYDVGVFSDSPTEGIKDDKRPPLRGLKLKGALQYTNADNRESFDKDSERFNANLFAAAVTTTPNHDRVTGGIGFVMPFPVTDVEHRTTKSVSLRDLVNKVRDAWRKLLNDPCN